jgi:isopentenyldiphosphate isomerase
MKEEPVDILDKQGNRVGQSMLKSEAHELGLWHGAAHVWIYDSEGDVLLQLRSPKKIVRPNIWDVSVAGHIASGKTPIETSVEEAEEELGLLVRPDELKFIGNATIDDVMEPGHWNHRVYLWIYALKRDGLNLSELRLEEDETADVEWLPLGQLAKDLKNPNMAGRYSPTPVSCYVAISQIPKLLAEGKNG